MIRDLKNLNKQWKKMKQLRIKNKLRRKFKSSHLKNTLVRKETKKRAIEKKPKREHEISVN